MYCDGIRLMCVKNEELEKYLTIGKIYSGDLFDDMFLTEMDTGQKCNVSIDRFKHNEPIDEDNHIFKENLLQIDKDEEADVNDNDNSKLIEKFKEDIHFLGNTIYFLSKHKPEFVNYYFPDMKIRIEFKKGDGK